jgi:hypothetical protein
MEQQLRAQLTLIVATIRTARSHSSGGYRFHELADMSARSALYHVSRVYGCFLVISKTNRFAVSFQPVQ